MSDNVLNFSPPTSGAVEIHFQSGSFEMLFASPKSMATRIVRVANDKKRDAGGRQSDISWLNLNTFDLWNRIAGSQLEFLPIKIHARAF
jgi:hypothetical protein